MNELSKGKYQGAEVSNLYELDSRKATEIGKIVNLHGYKTSKRLVTSAGNVTKKDGVYLLIGNDDKKINELENLNDIDLYQEALYESKNDFLVFPRGAVFKIDRENSLQNLSNILDHIEIAEFITKKFTEYNKKLTELQARQIKEKYDVEVLENKKQLLQNTLNDYYTEEKTRVEEKVKKAYNSAVAEMKDNLQLEGERINLELKVQFDELEKYRLMRAAVNDAIMRERQLQEQSEFYKINLSEQDIADLLMLRELAPRFNNRELLNKVIYESYIKRPLQEMIKRVLKGRSPSGIYKITREKTGEIYIGRAVSVDKRWTEHAKMAFSIGSIAHSTLHTIMEKDGIWNFTFELLEEVPKENLNEREKYYIEFYDSKNFGLNQKTGNQ